MSVSRSVAEVLAEHVTLEVEGIDRMYLNVYVPGLQREQGVACFFRFHRGNQFASSALMDAARFRSLRNNKTLSTSERLTTPAALAVGPVNAPVFIVVDWFNAPEAKLTPRSVLAVRSTLQKRTFNRICCSIL